jgi:hypothetical protein
MANAIWPEVLISWLLEDIQSYQHQNADDTAAAAPALSLLFFLRISSRS